MMTDDKERPKKVAELIMDELRHSCGTKLSIYQPEGQHPTLFCSFCDSPWMVHCRDATTEDLDNLMKWFTGDEE